MTIAQLTDAWGCELAKDGRDSNHYKQDLLHVVVEDIVNGRLDDSGPLWDGRRSGGACITITPKNKPGFIEGHKLLDLASTGPANHWLLHYVLVMKEAVLDFARRHQLPAPSWWSDYSETRRQNQRSQSALHHRARVMRRLPTSSR